MNLLSITGAPQSGKTRTLIILAQAAEPSELVAYVSLWMRREARSLLYSAGMPARVKLVSVTAAREGFRGLCPSTVLIDDFNALAKYEQHGLLEACKLAGARYVVTAGL